MKTAQLVASPGASGGQADIVCLGDLMAVCQIDSSLPGRNKTLPIERDAFSSNYTSAGRQIDRKSEILVMAGPALNVARHLTDFGAGAALVGACGEDARELLQRTLRAGRTPVKSCIQYHPGFCDLLCFFWNGRAHYSTYVFRQLQELGECFASSIKRADIVVLTGSRHAILRTLFGNRGAFPAHSLIIFNPSYAINTYSSAELQAAAAACDWLFLNRQELKAYKTITGTNPSSPVASRMGVVTTLDKRGTVLYLHGRKPIKKKALPVASDRHAIGAGDALLAAMVNARLNTDICEKSLLYGMSAAAMHVEGQTGFTWAEIEDRYRSIPEQ